MAEKEKKGKGGADSFVEGLVKFLKEHWPWLAILFFIFLIWNFHLTKGFFSLIGTIFLGWVAWKFWIHYIQQDFISGIDFVLLEIIPPREVLRSPKAMELFISNALYHWSMKGGREEYWQGAVWFWFSLEIVSIDGQVHFFIRTPTRIKELVETQIYAQYPQAQVKVVEDYTLAVDAITPQSAWNGWGCEFRLKNPEAFPIKTYIDYGLDKDPKEEYKIDPISPVIELFGSIKKGEQMWMQIVIRPSKKQYHTKGTWFGHHDWVTESNVQIKKILKPYTRTQAGVQDEIATQAFTPEHLKKILEGMIAKTGKIGFDTGIRIMYIAKKEAFDMNNRRNMRLIFRQYAKPDTNELERFNSAQADFYGGVFPASPKTVMMLTNRMLHEFRERAFFHLPLHHHLFSKHIWRWPFDGWIRAYPHHETFVLNVEELATLWHFPGQILKVPTLERVESKEATPPTNLPI